MKKMIITTAIIIISSGNFFSQSKTKSIIPAKDKLQRAWSEVDKKKDTTKNLLTKIKYLVQQKIVYRTKVITQIDTVYRIDTCINIITVIDSNRIAIEFMNRQQPSPTKHTKKVFFIFRKKK